MIPDLVDISEYCPWPVLPPGLHCASLAEIEAVFATTPHRLWLFKGFVQVVDALKLAKCNVVYLDGSFTTGKPHPGDFDGCWEIDGVDFDLLDPVLLNFADGRAAQKAKYRGEMFISHFPAAPHSTFFEFFQVEKHSGLEKGIIRLEIDQ